MRRKPLATSTCSSQPGFSPQALQLQRTLGNQRVGELIQAEWSTQEGAVIGLQPKLTVGAADDQYKQKADRVARQIISMPEPATASSMQRVMPPEEDKDKDKTLRTKPLAASITPFVQRQTESSDEPKEKEMRVQTKLESSSHSPIRRACSACSLDSKEKSGSESH